MNLMENARKIRFSLTFLLMIYNIPEVLWMRRIVFSWELRWRCEVVFYDPFLAFIAVSCSFLAAE